MCGLVYLYHSPQTEGGLKNKVQTAIERLAHRGPDDHGIWCKPPVAIGHRRLAIIDLEASLQPMCDPHNRFVLAYNGEVYNFRTLREELRHQWSFRTQGDTEVVLAGLVIHGSEFFKKMEGMWALVLWDNIKNKLLLARDRMGKKPLYYRAEKDSFACASELPALKSLSNHACQEDLDSTADYFRYGYYLPGTTAYKDIKEVLPGHVLEWNLNDGIKESSYWELKFTNTTNTKMEAALELRSKLISAVEKRLIADVEVGAFLSGGIDSSLIVGILSRELNVTAKTFTIGFKEPSYDESYFAKHVAELYGTQQFYERLGEWDGDLLQKLIFQHMGQPFNDPSLLPTAMVSNLASRHVKVALSGDGSDEVFSGYQRYQANTLLRWYTRLPKLIQRNIERLVRLIPEPMAHHSRSLIKKAHLFLDIANLDNNIPYTAPTYYAPNELAQLAPDLIDKGHRPPQLPQEARADGLLEMMTSDSLVYLPQDILAKVDRASMAYSLEVRTPFLDKDVLEFAFSLPRGWHRNAWKGKRMLHQAFADLVPPMVRNRRKQGFSVPIQNWFKEKLGAELANFLHDIRTPLDRTYVLSMLKEHQKGLRDHGLRLWGIYIYLMWLRLRTNQ